MSSSNNILNYIGANGVTKLANKNQAGII